MIQVWGNSKVVSIPLSQGERELARRNSERTVSTFQSRLEKGGGRSNFREDRSGTIVGDGLVGQTAALAGCKWLYGNALGHYMCTEQVDGQPIAHPSQVIKAAMYPVQTSTLKDL